MANTNAQAINWTNTIARPMADELFTCYLSAKKLVLKWNAEAVATAIPNDATVISDGSATDGRAPVTDAQVTAIVTRCQEFISWFENGLVASPFNASATLATLNTVVAVAVNGQTKF